MMLKSLIILFHFFNLTVGLTGLFFLSRRFSHFPSNIQKSYIQQALVYNFTIVTIAVSDFMEFYFWQEVKGSGIAHIFLSLVYIVNLFSGVFWVLLLVLLVYKFFDIKPDFSNNLWLKITSAAVIAILVFSSISMLFRMIPGFFQVTAIIINSLSSAIILGYSIYLYFKSMRVSINERKKALRILGVMFIVISSLWFIISFDIYTLQIIPPVVNKFASLFMDLMFNSFIVIWSFKYFILYNNDEAINTQILQSEDEFVEKYQISKRELEVIRLVCSGKSNQDIADSLYISIGTVKDHLYKIYKKVGVKNRTQLAKLF